MKTYVATPESRERNWLVVDASGQTLGRLATRIADALRGKRKPEYTPHVDVGDFVIVVNAEKIAVSGKKREEKRYYRHSGYPGGLRSRTLEEMLARRPEEVIRLALAAQRIRDLGGKTAERLPGRVDHKPVALAREWGGDIGLHDKTRPPLGGRTNSVVGPFGSGTEGGKQFGRKRVYSPRLHKACRIPNGHTP